MIEIERKYVLRAAPPIPAGAEIWRIEQGYLSSSRPQPSAAHNADERGFEWGRLRRIEKPDDSVEYFHTIKTGSGLIRSETERRITEKEFQVNWPRTEGRRLSKTRYRVRHGDALWEIDVFQNASAPLVLAEVELPSAQTSAPIPAWLADFIVREVTDDPNFTNASIAARLGRSSIKP